MTERDELVLLPCPFCGGKAEMERVGTPRQSTVYRCTECSCSIETGEEWGYGYRWNTRDELDKAEKHSISREAAYGPLVDAMWQLLDDMGTKGAGVCLAAKAQARVAFEPFRNDDAPLDWPLEEAQKILKEANR